MPTIEQIRAARALLGWSQSDLADNAGLSQTGIARIENGTNKPNTQTLEKITAAFDDANIEFLGTTGVRKKSGEIKTFKGVEGFKKFMDDIYETAKTEGGEFCLHNARPDNWYKWLGEDWFKMHSKRMSDLGKKIRFKITAQEGEKNLISNEFAEYRWFPKDKFHEHPFYAYGKKLAFVQFEDENVVVHVFEHADFSDAFKILFNIAWDNVAKKPN